MTRFLGEGTRSSPIAIDEDLDEEGFIEFCPSPVQSEVSLVSRRGGTPDSYRQDNSWNPAEFRTELSPEPESPINMRHNVTPHRADKKRKRTGSFTDQNGYAELGPSNSARPHTSLEHRLSQPESKKARKRRRKLERQAMEEARVRNINWLNGIARLPSGEIKPLPAKPPPQNYREQRRHSIDDAPLYPPPPPRPSYWPSGHHTRELEPYEEDLYEFYDPHLETRSPSPTYTGDWVSSMANAGEGETSASKFREGSVDLPPPPSAEVPDSRSPSSSPLPARVALPEPTPEQHPLPPKPPPAMKAAPAPKSTIIGMMPDPDPASKHGTFSITPTMKDMGLDSKKRTENYLPNPSCTLVLEQLPKSLRNADFIKSWAKRVCGFQPVHLFVGGPPAGKALVEFASAELARKAWNSPKLNPRADQVRVWWYRVDGIGADSGVGEIEEGEIEEGEIAEMLVDSEAGLKETKKQRKARLAKAREEKRQKREMELRAQQEAQGGSVHPGGLQSSVAKTLPNIQIPAASVPPQSSSATTPNPFTIDAASQLMQMSHNLLPTLFDPTMSIFSGPWSALGMPSNGYTPFAEDSFLPFGQPMDMAPFWQNSLMDNHMDVDHSEESLPLPRPGPGLPNRPTHAATALNSSTARRGSQMGQPHNSRLAPAPGPPLHTSSITSKTSTSQGSASVPPVSNWLLSPVNHSDDASVLLSSNTSRGAPTTAESLVSTPTLTPVSRSASNTPLPSEPRAMRNAPTKPSFMQKDLLVRRKELLEEKMAKTREELAISTANIAAKKAAASGEPSSAVENNAASTPSSSSMSASAPAFTPLIKPSMDLGETQATEDRLRKLVLQSKNLRAKGAVGGSGPTTNNNSLTTSTSLPSGEGKVQPDPHPRPDLPDTSNLGSLTTSTNLSSTTFGKDDSSVKIHSQSHSFTLEDLAVSFITQTIETVKSHENGHISTPIPTSSSTLPKIETPQPQVSKLSNANVKMELLAKQKRLEQHIAESKALMSQLAGAKTKQEKDSILKMIRESSRLFEEGQRQHAASTPPPVAQLPPSSTGTANMKHAEHAPSRTFSLSRWPTQDNTKNVVIVSDDEDSDVET